MLTNWTRKSSWLYFLAHLIRMLRVSFCDHLPSVVRPSVCMSFVHTLKTFPSKTPELIFFKLHVEPSVKGRLKICTNGHGPLIKMAAIPICGKTLKNLLLWTKKALGLNLGILNWGLKVYHVYSNKDRRLTFDLFTARSVCVPIHLYGKNVEKSFSHNILKSNGLTYILWCNY